MNFSWIDRVESVCRQLGAPRDHVTQGVLMEKTLTARCCGTEFVVCNDPPHFYKDQDGLVHGPFWDEFCRGEWESDTLRVISLLADSGAGALYDIGAWIGPISLFSASLGLDVVSIEPDPAAFVHLYNNAMISGLNGKMSLINGAVRPKVGHRLTELYSNSLGNSETSIMRRRSRAGRVEEIANAYMSVSLSMQELFDWRKPEKSSVMKVDVEGAEFILIDDIVELLGNGVASLLLSLHPENIVDFIGAGRRAGAPEIRHLMRSTLEKLPMAATFYWKTNEWHVSDHNGLLDAASRCGEEMKSVIATNVDVAPALTLSHR